eukprot:COSAG04_NODE_19017_length_427_cov_0.463415_1_plen_68_part_10
MNPSWQQASGELDAHAWSISEWPSHLSFPLVIDTVDAVDEDGRTDFFQAEDGIRDSPEWLEFRRVLFR